MPVKKYGIYLAYSPVVDMRAEGLGRHLAEFLKGAQARGDISFVIACPSWLRANLLELFDASGVHSDSFEILSPKSKPLLLRAHECYAAFRRDATRSAPRDTLKNRLRELGSKVIRHFERRLAASRSLALAGISGIALLPLLALGALFLVSIQIFSLARIAARKARSLLARHPVIRKYRTSLGSFASRPRPDSVAIRLYRFMEEAEVCLMREMIEERKDIAAWYSPTVFWPHFNEISAPRLTCVPDVVLTDFPVGFTPLGDDRILDILRKVERTIENGQYFVTYSADVKWRTLVDRYHVDPDAIAIVQHGANRLDNVVTVSGFADNATMTDALCRDLLRTALGKALNNGCARLFSAGDMRFIFYASQFRPNKNVLSLLRAYEYLLKRRYIGHKLILTGDPQTLPEIGRFVREHNLQNDVLFLNRLSVQELAACYKMADLAVNPSLSEGGCPFTFTEALSVGTPVVMARIPVTEEVIINPELQDAMLFDPYDWKDIADKIEWGLQNRQLLLTRQKPFYEQLAQRSWRNVVDEYVEILDRISTCQAEVQ